MNSPIPKDVVESFIFANTPAYLYRKLIATTFVAELHDKSDSELILLLNSLVNDKLNYISAAYAVFLVVIDRETEESANIKSSLAKILEWSSNLQCIHDQEKPPPTETVLIKIPSFATN